MQARRPRSRACRPPCRACRRWSSICWPRSCGRWPPPSLHSRCCRPPRACAAAVFSPARALAASQPSLAAVDRAAAGRVHLRKPHVWLPCAPHAPAYAWRCHPCGAPAAARGVPWPAGLCQSGSLTRSQAQPGLRSAATVRSTRCTTWLSSCGGPPCSSSCRRSSSLRRPTRRRRPIQGWAAPRCPAPSLPSTQVEGPCSAGSSCFPSYHQACAASCTACSCTRTCMHSLPNAIGGC